jgi:Tfp pilus assembly protein FimT
MKSRFQFSLRSLFVVTAIVAVQCAVCLPMLRKWQQARRVEEELRRMWVEIDNARVSDSRP